MSGYLVATQIVERLSGDNQVACIAALHQAEQGQSRLSSGDWNGALTFCGRAQEGFAKIPEARPLLGVTKGDIAVAFGNLGRHSEAKQVAEEALPLVQGMRELAQTEAALHMTIGIGHYQEGDSRTGASHFDMARRIYQGLPGGGQMLAVLNSNEARLKTAGRKEKKKWWKPW